MKGFKSSGLEKMSQFIKIHKRRLKAIQDNFDVIQPQQGTGIYMNAMIRLKNCTICLVAELLEINRMK